MAIAFACWEQSRRLGPECRYARQGALRRAEGRVSRVPRCSSGLAVPQTPNLRDQTRHVVPRCRDEVEVRDGRRLGVMSHIHVGHIVVVATEPDEVVAADTTP